MVRQAMVPEIMEEVVMEVVLRAAAHPITEVEAMAVDQVHVTVHPAVIMDPARTADTELPVMVSPDAPVAMIKIMADQIPEVLIATTIGEEASGK